MSPQTPVVVAFKTIREPTAPNRCRPALHAGLARRPPPEKLTGGVDHAVVNMEVPDAAGTCAKLSPGRPVRAGDAASPHTRRHRRPAKTSPPKEVSVSTRDPASVQPGQRRQTPRRSRRRPARVPPARMSPSCTARMPIGAHGGGFFAAGVHDVPFHDVMRASMPPTVPGLIVAREVRCPNQRSCTVAVSATAELRLRVMPITPVLRGNAQRR